MILFASLVVFFFIVDSQLTKVFNHRASGAS